MSTFLRTTALAAGILALGAFAAGPAAAWDKHRHHGWYHGYGHPHGYRAHGGKKVVVVGPQRRVVHTRRVVVVTAPPPPPQIVYRVAPVVVPVQALVQRAAYCREYTQSVVIGGMHQIAYGTACRQPDGSWRAVN